MKALLVAALLLVPAAVAQDVHLSAYQPGPTDLSGWRSLLVDDGYTVRNTAASPLFLAEVSDPADLIYVIAGMERAYSNRESAALDAFMRDGGTVILGDNGGRVPNGFAKQYGVLYFGSPLRDQSFEYNQSFVRVAFDEWGVKPILGDPTALLCADEACLANRIAQSGNQSFLDLNRNGIVDASDDVGPFTMSVRLQVGKGTIVFLPTPAFATNDLLDDPDNELFLQRLLQETAPEARTVVFDESRHVAPSSEAVLVSFLTILGGFSSVPIARALVALACLVAAALFLRRAKPFESWSHRHDLDASTGHQGAGTAAERLAELMRLKIKLDHQLVDPGEEDYEALAPDDDVRRLIQQPDRINSQTLRAIMARHLPDASDARTVSTPAADIPPLPDGAPST